MESAAPQPAATLADHLLVLLKRTDPQAYRKLASRTPPGLSGSHVPVPTEEDADPQANMTANFMKAMKGWAVMKAAFHEGMNAAARVKGAFMIGVNAAHS